MKNLIKISILIILLLGITRMSDAQTYFSGNTLGTSGSALGASNTATGFQTFSSGYLNQSTGNYSASFGVISKAQGQSSFVVGQGGVASGTYSLSLGYANQATGYNSVAIGRNATASSNYSISLGYYSQATNTYSYSFGRNAISSGVDSYTFGYYSGGSGNNSFSIGNYSVANGSYSLSLGSYVSTSNSYAMTIGRGVSSGTKLNNNITNSLMVGFNSDIPTLFVGASAGAGTTGNVGIGTTVPNAKLHVKGNANNFYLEGTDHTYMSFYPDGYSSGRKSYFGFASGTSNTVTLANEISGGDVEILTTGGGDINLRASVWATEVVVQLTDPWPDFVFTKDYGLMSLAKVEAYINENSHLPNVPSEAEITEEGINLGQMDAILLQKIEELTLYIIAQQKQIDELQKEIKN